MAFTKKQKKGLLRGALVTFISLVVMVILGTVLALVVPESYYNVKALYQTEDTDVLFVGNSHAIAGLNAAQFGQETGLKTLNISTTSQTVLSADLLVKEAIRTQHPKTIFVETFSMIYPTPTDSTYLKALDSDSSVFRSVNDLTGKFIAMVNQPGYRRKFDAFLPIFKYHANWKTPERWNLMQFSTPAMDLNKQDYMDNHMSGTRQIPYVMTEEQLATYTDYVYQFDVNSGMRNNQKYWDSIIETCRDNEVEVVFVTLPWLPQFVNNTNYDDINAVFADYFAKKGVTYIDYNAMHFPLEYTDFAKESASPNQHLNISGAEKVTTWLSKWYTETYQE